MTDASKTQAMSYSLSAFRFPSTFGDQLVRDGPVRECIIAQLLLQASKCGPGRADANLLTVQFHENGVAWGLPSPG